MPTASFFDSPLRLRNGIGGFARLTGLAAVWQANRLITAMGALNPHDFVKTLLSRTAGPGLLPSPVMGEGKQAFSSAIRLSAWEAAPR